MAHGWAAPAVAEPAHEVTADTLARFVERLAVLPGAEYVLAVDPDGGRVRGEAGGAPESDLAVLDWARRVAAVAHERRQALEDLVLTTEAAFHVVRLVPADPEAHDDAAAWVCVRIDRARGNLAQARRALAGRGAPGSPRGPRALTAAPTPADRGSSRAAPPAPSTTPWPPSPAEPPGAAPDRRLPAPRFTPFEPPTPSRPTVPWPAAPARSRDDSGPGTGAFPTAMPAPAGKRAERASARDAAPVRTRGDAWPRLGDRDTAPGSPRPFRTLAEAAAPTAVPHAADDGAPSNPRLPLTIRQAARWRDAGDTGSAGEPAAPVGRVPAARAPTEGEPAPSLPAPRSASLFEPAPRTSATGDPAPDLEVDTGVFSVPPPPPGVIVPRPYAPAPGRVAESFPEPRPGPDAESAPLDPDASDDPPELPRRRPGAHLAPGVPATPRTAPTVHHPVAAVAGTAAFSNEHSVLRRLLDGLRRLS